MEVYISKSKQMNKFNIVLSSVPDRENLVAEIWYNEILIAEINQETENLKIELYFSKKIELDLDAFLVAVENAKEKIRAK